MKHLRNCGMKKILIVALLAVIHLQSYSQDEDFIIFTSYQNFLSRLYVLNIDGSVYDYYEYENYRLQDMTVIDNEVYVTDAFIPCVYKVGILTGDLELIMHDTWLYYFYGLAFDGDYFYVDEWNLNRYDINGVKDGTASFDEDVMGATFANNHYWMLNNENEIKCWNFSEWPELYEISVNSFIPPTSSCRGLWFDGECFWTAESKEGQPGKIFRFDFEGQVVEEWNAPAFRGWGAVKVANPQVGVTENNATSFDINIFPNPFIYETTIQLQLNKKSRIRIDVYGLSGKRHFVLFDDELLPGLQHISWVPSLSEKTINPGLYILKIRIDDRVYFKKVLFKTFHL